MVDKILWKIEQTRRYSFRQVTYLTATKTQIRLDSLRFWRTYGLQDATVLTVVNLTISVFSNVFTPLEAIFNNSDGCVVKRMENSLI